MTSKERSALAAFSKVSRALKKMVDGIDGYEEEGFDVSRFWKVEDVKFARKVLDIINKSK